MAMFLTDLICLSFFCGSPNPSPNDHFFQIIFNSHKGHRQKILTVSAQPKTGTKFVNYNSVICIFNFLLHCDYNRVINIVKKIRGMEKSILV